MGINFPYYIYLKKVIFIKNKSRIKKAKEYEEKYKNIPVDFKERLSYMIDKYHISEKKMDEILMKKENMIHNLYYYQFKVVELFEDPEGAKRPRFRITKSNFHNAAINNPNFVHVYSPNAKDDFEFMKRLTEQDLYQMNGLINTPCDIKYNAYIKTPSYFNTTDIFLSEIGLIRPSMVKPDWDNIGKKYCDMYNSNIWLDDAQVNDGEVHRYYSILPRIEIYLKYLNVVYNKKQYERIINRKDYNGTPLNYLDNKGDLNYV